jgi:exopolysaccharide biosynthesis protein
MKHALAKRNPRSGVGMIEPGHYIFIVVDGREPAVSIGMNFTDFAQLFLQYGCKVAFNFDGGQSASMCFMGKQLNVMHVQEDGFVQRRMPDVFAIGTSELVTGK